MHYFSGKGCSEFLESMHYCIGILTLFHTEFSISDSLKNVRKSVLIYETIIESQEVVRVDFHDTDPPPYEQPFNVIPVATERNNLSVAEPMKLSVGSFHLTIPNGTDPQLLAQTLRIVKELEC